jgi:hypothetical protein
LKIRTKRGINISEYTPIIKLKLRLARSILSNRDV